MRISDWSSDVCSSDLGGFRAAFFYWSNRTWPLALSARSALYSAWIQPNLRLVSTGPIAPQANSRSRARRSRRRQEACPRPCAARSEEHTSELQSLMRISYAVFCLKKKNNNTTQNLKI